MDYSDLVKLGLLGAQDQKDAALMGLLNLGSQIGAASAPRTSPTPPPIDLSKAMGVYQGHMKNALTQGALAKKLQDEKNLRTMFGRGAWMKGMPTNIQNYASHLGMRNPALAIDFIGKVLSRTPRETKYHNVIVGDETTPRRISTSEMEKFRLQGKRIRPYSAPLIKNEAPNAMAAYGVETWKKASTAASKASQDLFQLNTMKSLLATGVPSGKLESWTLPFKNLLASFGVVNGQLSIQEAITSLGNELALGKHGPGMGPMTDADFKIYQGIMPGLKNTRAGNALVMARLEREYLGKQMYAEIIREQIDTLGPAKVNTAQAWKMVAQRLDAEYGPLIPQFEKASDVGDDMIGRVVVVVGEDGQPKPFLVRP